MKPSPAILRIGSVAAAAGLTVDAVRHYERLGLLKPAARTDGGFRTYGRDPVQRLAFIRQAQRIGLQLREIRDLLADAEQAANNTASESAACSSLGWAMWKRK